MNRRMCYVQFSWPSLYWLTRRSERGSNAQHTPLTLKQQVQMMIRKSSSTFSMKSDTQFVWISICHTLIKNMYISFYRCSNGHNVSLCLSLEADDLSWVFVCAYSEHFLSTPLTMSEAYTTSEQVCDRSMYCLLVISYYIYLLLLLLRSLFAEYLLFEQITTSIFLDGSLFSCELRN